MAKRDFSRGRASAGGLVLSALVTLVALAVLVPVVKTAGAGAGLLPPPRNELGVRLAAARAMLPNARVDEEALRVARERAQEAPLSHYPFFVAARAAEQKGRFAEATRLMEEARRRRPTYTLARLSLMGYYARAGRHFDAISEADVAVRLSPEATQAILPVLADMLHHPEARDEIARVLHRNPGWRASFLEVAEPRIRPQDAAGLLDALRKLRPPHGTAHEEQLLVDTLARAGRHAEARAAWLRLVPPGERTQSSLVFDGDFRGASAPPPFNWTFTDAEAGRAQPSTGGAGESAHLAVSYFGAAATTLAEQTVVLGPGRYTLSLSAKADRETPSGALAWRIACIPSNAEIGVLRLERFNTSGYGRYKADFEVPAGCRAQKLTLAATPGDLSQPINVNIAQLRLDRRG